MIFKIASKVDIQDTRKLLFVSTSDFGIGFVLLFYPLDLFDISFIISIGFEDF